MRPRKTPDKIEKPERVSQFTTAVDDETLEFIRAIETFKASKRRPFPSWGEILQVVKDMGYKKV